MRRFTIAVIVALSPVLTPAAALGQDGWRWTAARPEESAAKPAVHRQPAAGPAPASHVEPVTRHAPATTKRRPAHGRTAPKPAGVATRTGWVSLEWPESTHEIPWQRLAWPDWTAAEVRPDTGSPDR